MEKTTESAVDLDASTAASSDPLSIFDELEPLPVLPSPTPYEREPRFFAPEVLHLPTISCSSIPKRVYPPAPQATAAQEALVQQIFRRSAQPDSNLGRSEIGGSPQQITRASAVNLLFRMMKASTTVGGLERLSGVFVDLGCGHGLVSMLAAVNGCYRSFGWEIDRFRVQWAKANVEHYFPYVKINHGDIKDWRWEIEMADYIFSFDLDYPPSLKAHIISELARNCGGWKVWASGKSRTWWSSFVEEAYAAHLIDLSTRDLLREFLETRIYESSKLRVTLIGSAEGHTIYLYTRRLVEDVFFF